MRTVISHYKPFSFGNSVFHSFFKKVCAGCVKAGIKVLFVQKLAKARRTLPGYYENSAAGQVDSGDTVEKAACKELKEELGIAVKPADLTLLGEFVYVNKFGACWMDNELVTPYLLDYSGKIVINKKEIEEGAFHTAEKIKQMIRAGEKFSPVFLEMFSRYLEILTPSR